MKNFIWKLKQRWMLFCDPDIKWRCTNCGWLPSHYNEYMSHYNEYMGENPHYCPQCGAKVINYKGELPFAEPDVTDKDFRKSIEEKFRVTKPISIHVLSAVRIIKDAQDLTRVYSMIILKLLARIGQSNFIVVNVDIRLIHIKILKVA